MMRRQKERERENERSRRRFVNDIESWRSFSVLMTTVTVDCIKSTTRRCKHVQRQKSETQDVNTLIYRDDLTAPRKLDPSDGGPVVISHLAKTSQRRIARSFDLNVNNTSIRVVETHAVLAIGGERELPIYGPSYPERLGDWSRGCGQSDREGD